MDESKKTLGQVIDDITHSLQNLDIDTQFIAMKAAIDHLKIPIPPALLLKSELTCQDHIVSPIDIQDEIEISSIRKLREIKQPSKASEMICIVAYYLSNIKDLNEKREYITTKEIKKYFAQARFHLPKNIKRTLASTKNAGYLVPFGQGKYKLSTSGYNLITNKLPKPIK